MVILWFICAFFLGAAAHPNEIPKELYTPTPVGCVHSVPSGSTVETLSTGGVLVHSPPSEHSLGDTSMIERCDTSNGKYPMILPRAYFQYDGWTTYTAYNDTSPTGFDQFLGYFSVPDEPKKRPEILYLFTGLQNIDWIPVVDPDPDFFDIIQPVLQYPADWGGHWSVKSWYVTLNAGALQSDEVVLDVGDKVFGNMTRTGPDSWFIGSTSVATQKTTTLIAKNARLKTQPWAYNTLECYGCDGCDTYPTEPCLFTDLSLVGAGGQPVQPKWIVDPKPSQRRQCHESSTVSSATSVKIDFGN